MNYIIVASSNFNDKALFTENVKLPSDATIIVKAKSAVSEWIKEMNYIPAEFNNYDEMLSFDPASTKLIAFWDGASKNVEKMINTFSDQQVIKYENSTLKSFNEMIEKIQNEKWKLGCKELVKKLPNYFWVVAASSSGKYHPKCDLGTGGLVRHSVMVAINAMDLVTAEIFVEDNIINKDMALIAGLFHDCMKQGNAHSGHTVFDHPILAAEFMAAELKDYIEEPYLSTICGAVRTHMGKWTTSDYAPEITLEKPTTAFQKLVHTADYEAARKYIAGLEEWQ